MNKTIKLPIGFTAAGIHSGLKKKRKDLAIFISEAPCVWSACFTTNKCRAASIDIGRKLLRAGKTIRAVIVNSGNANCMTGTRGVKDARIIVKEVEKAFSLPKGSVLSSSTGIIGRYIDIRTLVKGLDVLKEHVSKDGLVDAASGIMTTDAFPKIVSRTIMISGKKVTITGVAKGAGMIAPEMATMLSYVFTDAAITKGAIKKALDEALCESFNAITVDGDMSTNDTAACLANGLASNKTIKAGTSAYASFTGALKSVMKELAIMIVSDGEGAGKVVEVVVTGAATQKDAYLGSKKIANSLLMKCAVHGEDPNWGRAAASIGQSGAAVEVSKLDITLDGVMFVKKGEPVFPKQQKIARVFKGKKVVIKNKFAQRQV